mmetsp:Transcript_1860/g.5625  ORF Transcript_1860/g.5625 Transcript_1860/m.5625 type:complete len:396 (-) Transcript_1860:177-1364(-)
MTRVSEAEALAKVVEAKLKEASESGPGSLSVRRALFGAFAALWNDAEEAEDQDALKVLAELRPKLKCRRPKHSLLPKCLMYFRLVLTVLVACWGSLCVLTLAPLRLLHPLLRKCGIPNGWLPMDLAATLWARAVLSAAFVKVKIDGKTTQEQWGSEPCGVVVYNHGSNLDPFIVSGACRMLAPKYLGKKTLFKFPFFGWMSLALGMVPINRGDREKAVRTMNETVGSIMRKWRRSVAVSPEGTRTTDGHLTLPFKKGTFHLQEQTKAPLLPVVIHGAFELWPPGQVFAAAGEVTVRVLPVQANEGATGTREASRFALQRSFAKTVAHHPELGSEPLSPSSLMECIVFLLGTAVVFRQFWLLYAGLTAAAGLGGTGIFGLFIAFTVVIAVVVDKFV